MSRWRLVLPLVAYFVSGVGLTCFNKFLLGSDYRFHFPITLILCHMLTNFLLSSASLASLRVPFIAAAFPNLSTLSSSSHGPSGPSPAPPLTSSSYYPSRLSFRLFLRRFVPIGVLFAADITLTNVSFGLVPVSLTEVVKGFAPAALMLYTWRKDELTALRAAQLGLPVQVAGAVGGWYGKTSVIVLLSAGIALTSYGDLNFRWDGFLAAFGALVSGVLKFILLEQLLDEEDEGEAEAETSRKAAEAAGKAGKAEVGASREAEEENGAPVEKAGKRSKGKYQQLSAAGDDDEDDGGAEQADANTSDHPSVVRIDSPTSAEPSQSNGAERRQESEGTVTVEMKPMDEESKEGDADGGDTGRDSPHKVIDAAPPLRRRSPQTSARHSAIEMTAIENGEEPTNFVLSARPASPTLPFVTPTGASAASLPAQPPLAYLISDTVTASSSASRLKPSPSASSLSSPRMHASPHKRLHPLLSLFYFSPVAAIVLVPTFYGLELRSLLYPAASQPSFVDSPAIVYQTAGLILASALLAFTLNLSELSLIQSTSALTLCVVATVKFLLVVVLTSALFEHEVSAVNAVGCCLSVLGVAGYNFLKYREMARQPVVAINAAEEAGGEKAQLMSSKR